VEIDRNLLRDQYRQAVEVGAMTPEYAKERLRGLERLFKLEEKRRKDNG